MKFQISNQITFFASLKLLVFAMPVLWLTSCETISEEEEQKTSVCECAANMHKMQRDMQSTENPEKVQKKYAKEFKQCDLLQNKMGPEEFQKELESCKEQ